MPRNSPRSLACPPLAPPAPHCAAQRAHSHFFLAISARELRALAHCAAAEARARYVPLGFNQTTYGASAASARTHKTNATARVGAMRIAQKWKPKWKRLATTRARSLAPRARAPHSRITRRRAAFERTQKKNSTVIIGCKVRSKWSAGFESSSPVTHLFLTCANW